MTEQADIEATAGRHAEVQNGVLADEVDGEHPVRVDGVLHHEGVLRATITTGVTP